MSRRSPLIAILVIACFLAAGCNGSRWASRDADYRQKYPKHTSSVPKTIKQAVDARHVRGKSGGYIAASGRGKPIAAGLEIGGFGYSTPCHETRLGLAGLLHDGGEAQLTGGLSGSTRLQTPTRVSPFVGVGAYTGILYMEGDEATLFTPAEDDYFDFEAAVFPELGLHYWLTHRTRLTTSLSYYVTTQGRDDDFLFYSVGMSIFPRDYEAVSPAPPIDCATAADGETATDWDRIATKAMSIESVSSGSTQSESPYASLPVLNEPSNAAEANDSLVRMATPGEEVTAPVPDEHRTTPPHQR